MAKDPMYEFVEETIDALDYIVRDSTIEVCRQMTQTQPSVVVTGGSYVQGKVAVYTSELINSFQITLSGKRVLNPLEIPQEAKDNPLTYPARKLDLSTILSGVKGGKTTTAVFTAPHAEAHEYDIGYPGRYFVRNAAMDWNNIVARKVRKFK